jgi:hypothetical protein
MEEVISRLRNLYRSFEFYTRPASKQKLSRIDRMRYLGGMEALLQTVGKLPSGVLWDFKPVTKQFLYFQYQTTENYQEFILRNCKEFIDGKVQ